MVSDVEFDKRLRYYEDVNDPRIIPGMYTVVRIDGKNFSKLTRETLEVEPFNLKLRDSMVNTLQFVMEKDFKCIYGYTQSDEISILLDPVTTPSTFNGKIRKLNSLMAAYASVEFNSCLYNYFGDDYSKVVFDCRTIQLPNITTVFDYFNWRISDSETNCMNQLCIYYLVKEECHTPTEAQKIMNKKNFAFKNELLFKHGVNFDKVENWKKRGIGVYWMNYFKDGYNPITKNNVYTLKKKLFIDFHLPTSNIYYNVMLNRIVK